MKARTKGQGKGSLSTVVTVLLFLIMLLVLVIGTVNLAAAAGEDGSTATYDAIQRAAVICYATEGFYPPTLSYIEKHYGVQLDRERYVIQYEVYATNVMPIIRVLPR